MAKKKKVKGKAASGEAPAPSRGKKLRGSVAHQGPRTPEERVHLSVMVALTLFGLALLLVFIQHKGRPYLAAREAEQAVRVAEAEILSQFDKHAAAKGIRVLGFESRIFPNLTQVTFIYQEPGSSERKAFGWAYRPETGEVNRIKSVAQFVDDHLLPDIKQLHADVTGVPGLLARVRHLDETREPRKKPDETP